MVHIIEENLLDEESVSGVHSSRVSHKKSYREYLKRWSRLLKYDSKLFLVHKHINMYGYGHQHGLPYRTCAVRVEHKNVLLFSHYAQMVVASIMLKIILDSAKA